MISALSALEAGNYHVDSARRRGSRVAGFIVARTISRSRYFLSLATKRVYAVIADPASRGIATSVNLHTHARSTSTFDVARNNLRFARLRFYAYFLARRKYYGYL